MTTQKSNPNRYNQTSATYVPARVDLELPPAWESAPVDTQLATVAGDLALRPGQHSGYVRTTDDALTHARADLLIAMGYIVAAGMTIAGLLILAALAGLLGWGIGGMVAAWIGGTGVAALIVLYANRRQSHHYSGAGLGHAEIASRERIALAALRLHAASLLKREVRHGR